MTGGFVPAAVLRSRGVPIRVARLDGDGTVVVDDDGVPVTAERHLRFDANVLSQVEEAFDGLTGDAWLDEAGRWVDDDERSAAVTEARNAGRSLPTFEQATRTYRGVEAFQQSLTARPNLTLRRVFAIAFGVSVETAGRMMLPDQFPAYQVALSTAWGIAQGLDPTQAAKLLAQASAAAAEAVATINAAVDDLTGSLPGTNGSPPGLLPVEATTSSGG